MRALVGCLATVLFFSACSRREEPKPVSQPTVSCPGNLEQLRLQLKNRYNREHNCTELERAVEALGASADGQGGWQYSGEMLLRKALADRFRVQVSSSLLPIGYIERPTVDGGTFLLIFAFLFPEKMQPLENIANAVRWDQGGLAPTIGKRDYYNSVGVYRRGKDGAYDSAGSWVTLESLSVPWEEHEDPKLPVLKHARACLPCQGWLCVQQPLVCFADFNGNGIEEVLLLSEGPSFSGMRVLEVDTSGKLSILFNEDQVSGRWERMGKEWVLVGDIRCEGGGFCGLGNSLCEPGQVYRFNKKTESLEPDPSLQSVYYPIEKRPAPELPDDCPGRIRPDGVRVYDDREGKFILYLPRAN